MPLPATQVSTSAAQLVGRAQNYNDETISGYRVALTLEPNDSLTITPSVYHQRHEGDAWSAYIAEVGDLKADFLEMSPHAEDFTLYDLTLNYDFGGAVLTSSTSFTDFSLLTTEPFERVLTAFFGAPYVAPYRSYIIPVVHRSGSIRSGSPARVERRRSPDLAGGRLLSG